jgi:beta-mannosidase
VPYKRLDLHDPQIAVSARPSGDSLEISLSCEKPAYFAALESRVPGRFDDNWLTLLPGRERLVRFTPEIPGEIQPADIAVRDLFTATCRPQ